METGHITLELLREAMVRFGKAEYFYPQWTKTAMLILNPEDLRAISEHIVTK